MHTGGRLDDKELIAAAVDGDSRAFGVLVERYQALAFRAAFLVTRDAGDAEDACQEGFVKAHRSLARFRRSDPFRPWLLKIVTNQAKNRLRSAGRRRGLALRAGAVDNQSGPAPDEQVIAGEDRRALLAASRNSRKRIARLSPTVSSST